jgi:hypothetical protein
VWSTSDTLEVRPDSATDRRCDTAQVPLLRSSGVAFDEHETALLRAHGFVLVADRVVFSARPPMPPDRVADVAAVCAGPLPDDLLALWATVGGGVLDYDLTVDVDGERLLLSWRELFGVDAPTGLALDGWLDHEIDLATDGGRRPDARLGAVPIGGFEHLERVYVRVDEGHAGEVVVWVQGLPGWAGAPEQDALVPLAPDLAGAFAALHLAQDPLSAGARHGDELLAAVDDARAAGLPGDLADRLIAHYRRASVG